MLHASDDERLGQAERLMHQAIGVGETAVEPPPLILERFPTATG